MAVKVKKKKASQGGLDWSPSAYQNGARQIRDAFDSFLASEPSWNNGLRQVQQLSQGFSNGVEGLGSFLTGTPQRKLQDPAEDSALFTALGGRSSTAAKRAAAKRAPQGGGGSDVPRGHANAPLKNLPAPMSFADYLRMAGQYLQQGSDANYNPLISQLKQNASEGDARLAAMYKAYGDSIAADAPSIQQNYDTGASTIAANGTQAADQTKAAYQAARDAQTAQFAQLGIPDAAANLAAQGGAAASDQAHALSNIAQNQQADANQNAQYKTSALNYNTGIGNASQLDAATQRAALQQQLASKLAEIESQRASDVSGQNVFNDALQLYGIDQDSASAQSKAAQQDFENQLAAQKLAMQQQGSGKTLQDALSQYNQLTKLAQQAGIGNDPSSLNAFLKNLQLAGKI